MLIFLLILLTALSGIVTLLIPKNIRLIEAVAALTAAFQLGVGMLVAFRVASGVEVGLAPYLSVDALSAILVFIITLLGSFATVYAIGYLRTEVQKKIIGFRRVRQFFVLLELYLAAMLFAVTAANPILTWVAIEATTLATAPFISFYNKPSAMEAAWKYLIINSVGLLFGLFGTLLFLTTTAGNGVFIDWQSIKASAGSFDPLLLKMAFIFVVVGYGTKVGLAPMHTWLPDAHSKAPSPISALLSGVLLNVALFAILRFKGITDVGIGSGFSSTVLISLGLLSMVIAALIILVQKNYKRLIAYSSVEHMGLIVLGIGLGGGAAFAALFHLVYHSLTKALLFFSTGNIFLKHSTTKIAGVRGVASTLPVTSVLFGVGVLAVTGMPPFGLFFTEIGILSAGIVTHPVISGIALLALIIGFVGFLRHMAAMLYGEPPAGIERGEADKWTVVAPLLLAVILIVISIYVPQPLKALIEAAALNFS